MLQAAAVRLMPQLVAVHWIALLDILIAAVVLYGCVRLVRGTRASQMVLGLLLLVAAFYLARWAGLIAPHWRPSPLLTYLVLGVLVLFQPEIRQGLAQLGRNSLFARIARPSQPRDTYEDVVLAAHYLSTHGTGALMVLERKTGLRTYIESGITLDARISYDLLLAIFRPGSPLHDGAAIVQGHRIAAAACFLPLAMGPKLSAQMGTRHRAALGISEETDAVAVVVSEASGEISLALGGQLESNLTAELLRERLAEIFHAFSPLAAGETTSFEIAGATSAASAPVRDRAASAASSRQPREARKALKR